MFISVLRDQARFDNTVLVTIFQRCPSCPEMKHLVVDIVDAYRSGWRMLSTYPRLRCELLSGVLHVF
jgi:hypothetical protein